MERIEQIKKQAIERIKQLNHAYGDDFVKERIELVESIGTKPVHVVSHKLGVLDYNKLGKWDNDTRWTISTNPEEEGWETDSGCTGYGIYPEVAEYYALCINEYPKLLSLIDTQKKEIEKHKKAFKEILDFYGFDGYRIKSIIEEALKQE